MTRSAVVAILLALPACAPAQEPVRKDAMRPQAIVTGRAVVSRELAVRLKAADGFRYVGGQRFVLFDVADAEQHLFVDADSSRMVRRLLWTQLEWFLPGKGDRYDYSADAVASLHGLDVRANVAQWTTDPRPGSDRAKVFELLAANGYRVPADALRVRLVRVLGADQRSEVMVIYGEAPGVGDPATVLARALESVRITLGGQ